MAVLRAKPVVTIAGGRGERVGEGFTGVPGAGSIKTKYEPARPGSFSTIRSMSQHLQRRYSSGDCTRKNVAYGRQV